MSWDDEHSEAWDRENATAKKEKQDEKLWSEKQDGIGDPLRLIFEPFDPEYLRKSKLAEAAMMIYIRRERELTKEEQEAYDWFIGRLK